ncbi:alpha/beta hydrolase family protein [Microlunatus soli]|uniref:Alpha/beta hydrolase family protein n=1 Tax=Microlunatus soli TaxID=630515 RepID=A0A1H1ZZ81_9ACTN|nr:acetylxylan esterase [Microlunatus soli]SDT38980.1 Alpha/beta hydrolase family protein [Microlunatus soli]
MPIADGPLAFHANLNGHLDVSLTLQTEIGNRTREQLDHWSRLRSGITSEAALQAEQRRIRAAVDTAIGGLPPAAELPGPHYLPGRLLGDIEILPLIFHSAPQVAVSATLYRPTGPVPQTGRGAVLITCGHTDAAKADPEYQRLARRLASTGLVVLIFDPIGQGERHSYLSDPSDAALPAAPRPTIAPGTTEHTYAGVQAWWHGQSAVRYFLRDALAALELLRALPEVDPSRVGVTGNSGGGYLCCLLMAVDPALAAAAPGTFVCGRGHYLDSGQRQDAEQILLGGTANGLDHGDLLIAMSPAPVLVLAAEYDFFPYPGTLAVLGDCNELLRRCGREPIALATTANGHHYDDQLAIAATTFFADRLGGRVHLSDPGEPFPVVDLQVSRTGQLGADDRSQKMIFDELPGPRSGVGDRCRDRAALAWLDAKVRGPRVLLDRSGRRWFDPVRIGDESVAQQGFWWTERGIVVAGVVTRPIDTAPRLLRVVLLDRGIPGLRADDRRATRTDAATLFLDVRGTGTALPHDREQKDSRDLSGSSYKLLSDLLWLDDSLQAGRAWDLLRTIDLVADGLLPEVSPERFEIIAEPTQAFTATIAALLDDRVQLELDQPIDVDSMISNRLWDDTDGRWQWVLPGWPTRFDSKAVPDLLGHRLRIRPTAGR